MPNQDYIAAQYDLLARDWAEAFRETHDNKPMYREVLGRFAEKIGQQYPIWDLGCGPGTTTKYLHNLGVKVSGLDLSKKMVATASRLNLELQLQQANMLDLDFHDESIAGIVAFYAIVHFAEDQVTAAFQEIFRVLQPGGLLLLTFHIGNAPLHLDQFLGHEVDIDLLFFTTDFIQSALKAANFREIEIIERPPYPDIEYPSQRAYLFAKK